MGFTCHCTMSSVNAVNAPEQWQWASDVSHTTRTLLVSMLRLSKLLSIDHEPEMLHIPLRFIKCQFNAITAPNHWQWARYDSHSIQMHLMSMSMLSMLPNIDNGSEMHYITYRITDPSSVNVHTVNASEQWQWASDASHNIAYDIFGS